MTRSLPLQTAAAPSVSATAVVQVYDPAMCCPTGLCGPGVDPALLALARDLRWLESQGVHVDRFGLAQTPDAFVSNPKITGLMQAFGDRALPATVVNGEVLTFGKYPTRDEITQALAPSSAVPSTADSSCGPGCDCR